MAIIWRVHLQDNGFIAQQNASLKFLGSELAVKMPGGGANLAQISLDSNGTLSIQASDITILQQLQKFLQYNLVVADKNGNISAIINYLTTIALNQIVAQYKQFYPGSAITIIKDI